MPLAVGARFGAYVIAAPLGAGGMGEVYRARDMRLNRDVALKILPETFAQDPDRVARFTREAQTLAALNHPNIATIFGIEHQDAMHGLVMELVEGPTLADRLRGGPIEWRDALRIARELAEAASAAHERGIIHRDLKPANIKFTLDGTLKVLDFGLAKIIDTAGATGPQGMTDVGNSPTLSGTATEAGVLLGTAPYMSPEQARGAPVDRRTDVWAFGCVLFEMLTGKQAFASPTVSDTLAALLRGEPEWEALPASLPLGANRLLRRCLAKDRKHRLADLHDAALEIADALDEDGETNASALVAAGQHVGAVAALAALAALVVGGAAGWLLRPVPSIEPVYLTIPLPPFLESVSGLNFGLPAFTSDGRQLFFVAEPVGGSPSVYRAALDSFDVEIMAERSTSPFLSPDDKWLGVVRDGALHKVPVEGGTPAPIPGALGVRAFWPKPDLIVVGTQSAQLFQIGAAGGVATPAFDGSSVQPPLFQPAPLDDDWFLAVQGTAPASVVAVHKQSLDVMNIAEGGSPTLLATGQLVFYRGGTLWAAPFNRASRQLSGTPVPVLVSVASIPGTLESGVYSVSSTGHLAFFSRGSAIRRKLVWVDRSGKRTAAIADEGEYSGPRLSPDGRFIAVVDGDSIIVIDHARGSRVRLGRQGALNRRPVWSADGREIVFQADTDIFRQSVDLRRSEIVLNRPGMQYPDDISPSSAALLFNEGGASRDLWVLRDGKPQPLLVTPASERGGAFSPDGAWIAFTSDESGRDEIYLIHPDGSGKTVVSTRGGFAPMWSASAPELFYREGNDLMVVRVGAKGDLSVPERLFNVTFAITDNNQPTYDVAADGRFLMVEEVPGGRRAELRVILNWIEEVKRKLRS